MNTKYYQCILILLIILIKKLYSKYIVLYIYENFTILNLYKDNYENFTFLNEFILKPFMKILLFQIYIKAIT